MAKANAFITGMSFSDALFMVKSVCMCDWLNRANLRQQV